MRMIVFAALAILLCAAPPSSAAAAAAADDEFMPALRKPPQPKPAGLPSPLGAARTVDEWQARRAELLRAWQDVIGPFPQRVPLATQVVKTESLPDHVRALVRYKIDADTTADAYVLTPPDAKPGRHPGVVVLHPTTPRTIADPVGLSGREQVHNALHLVRRGYVCVVPRNYLWTFPGRNYQETAEAVLADGRWKTGMARMTWDAIRATDLLLEQPGVDPDRVGSLGHSLGAKEVLYLAAFDERIKATVSCEGGVGVSFSNWDALWYLGPQVKSPDFKRDHHELVALIAPRALLIIGGESADGARSWPYVEANSPVWALFGASDRIGLLRHTYGHDFPPPGDERERVYLWLDHWLRQ